jgi:hypothetical protein
MKLYLKFAPEASDASRQDVIAEAQRLGATAVRPLVPGDDDPVVRSRYIVELGEDADPQSVSAELRNHGAVMSVEPEFRRYLVA